MLLIFLPCKTVFPSGQVLQCKYNPIRAKARNHDIERSVISGCPDLHELHLHGHVDGEEHPDGVRVPQDQGVLPGEARAGVPGGGHEVGGQGRDDGRAHDHRPLHERAPRLSEVLHGAKLYLFRGTEVSSQYRTGQLLIKSPGSSFNINFIILGLLYYILQLSGLVRR